MHEDLDSEHFYNVDEESYMESGEESGDEPFEDNPTLHTLETC
jgi:hypothetical protein